MFRKNRTSLYAYVSVMVIDHIEGSYPIEWCIGEPIPHGLLLLQYH